MAKDEKRQEGLDGILEGYEVSEGCVPRVEVFEREELVGFQIEN
jgi:hypothetical protein